MVSQPPTIPRQELRDTEGQTFAYLVPADELHRLLAEAEELQKQVATLRRQKEYYLRELDRVLQTFVPPPMTEAEIQEALANPIQLSDVLAELSAK